MDQEKSICALRLCILCWFVSSFFPVFFWPVRILSFCGFHPCDGEIPLGSSQKEILGEGIHTADIFVIFGALKY